ncbi:FtsX-like permease family protein [Dactylosporangium sp. NPDC050688]|uniref:FtsX-like permease family protein n=1 Tax=Dactylosporangium sp. NPDC050688 TaxID=3157217 RepID=UPI0033C2E581
MHEGLRKRLATVGNLDGTRVAYHTAMPGYAGRASLIEKDLRGTVLPISVAGLLVGLLVVMAASVFWVRRRGRELVVLATFGATARWLGVKAALEVWPALAAGAVVGWGLAGFLVARVGPSSVVSYDARVQSLLAASVAFLSAVTVLGVTAGVACRALTGAPPASRTRRWMTVLPWELAILMAAAVYWFAGGGQYMVRLGDVLGTMVQIPAKLLVVPMLVMVGLGVLGARLVVTAVRRRARVGTVSRSAVRLLYARRVRHAVVAAAALALITAVPVALAVYGGTATKSVRATLAAQARLATGSDVVVHLAEPASVPPALADRATPVLRLDYVQIADKQVSLLVVDPASFARDAYWDDRLDDATLAQVLHALTSAPAGTLPAVASAPIAGGAATMAFGADPPIAVSITSVATLPAQRGGYPVIIIDRDALAGLGVAAARSIIAQASPQLWVRGDPARTRALIDGSNLKISFLAVADDRYVNTFYQPVTYTFAYLAALSLLTGIVAMVGFLLYLESRLPVLRRGFVMLRMMGLSSTTQGWLLLGELTAPLVTGCVIGLGLAVAAVLVMRDQLNVDPGALPGTVLSIPWPVMAGLLAVIGVFAAVVALVTHWRLTRSRVGEVLRDVD